MNCPVCKTTTLTPTQLEDALPASICPKCAGTWISSGQYWTWLEAHGPHVPTSQTPEPPSPANDSKGAKICPECGHIAVRYKVGHGVGFCIDQCGNCHGFWLDKNEWDVLRAHHLHDEIHLILDASWQRQIRMETSTEKLEEIYAKRFGGEVFLEVKRIREWLEHQPQRSALLAYLNDQKE